MTEQPELQPEAEPGAEPAIQPEVPQPPEGLMARAEYRYDNARRPVFLRNVGGVQNDQQTVAAELSYVF